MFSLLKQLVARSVSLFILLAACVPVLVSTTVVASSPAVMPLVSD